MEKFNYKMSIEAPVKRDADIKIKALTLLSTLLSPKELEKLAYVVKEEPAKTALAKQALGL